MYKLKDCDTMEKCEAKARESLNKMLSQIADICEECKEIHGEKQRSLIDLAYDNAEKLRMGRDLMLNMTFLEFANYSDEHLLPHRKIIEENKETCEEFFTDKKNKGIFAKIQYPEAVEFFRELWTKHEDHGGLTEHDREAAWRYLNIIISAVIKWKTLGGQILQDESKKKK